jgi:hypothetical protein
MNWHVVSRHFSAARPGSSSYLGTMPFRKVDARFAGPGALGILVPMGPRTLVVMRPRALPWDFVPTLCDEEGATSFPLFNREQAAIEARRCFKSLEASLAAQVSPVETACDSAETCFQIRIRTDGFLWLACRRAPGESFRPIVFATRGEAETAAAQIEAVVFPPAEAVQDVYFNTQNFAV